MDRRLSVASLVHSSSSPPPSPLQFRSGLLPPASSPSPSTTMHPKPAPPPATSSIVDTQDENVLIAMHALGDMRTAVLGGPTSAHHAHSPSASSSSYGWDATIGTSAQPTPSLSAASTSSQTTSPSIMTHSLAEEDSREDTRRSSHSRVRSESAGSTADDFLLRLSNVPLVNTALRAYDYSKASSRVVKYGAGLVESSVKSISRPVMDRLPVGQLDEFACRQLDRIEKYTGKPSSPARGTTDDDRMDEDDRSARAESRGRAGRPSPAAKRQSSDYSRIRDTSMRRASSRNEDDQDGSVGSSEQQVSIVQSRSSWQTMLVEAGGIGAAVSEESMKRLKYCLEWLQYATAHIDQQIAVLRQFLVSLDSTMSNDPGALVPAGTMVTLTDIKRDVVATVRQVVEVMTKYAGGALPEPARASVRAFILILPERWANAMQQQQTHAQGSNPSVPVSPQFHTTGLPPTSSTSGPQGGIGSTPTAVAVQQAAHKVLTLATESLDMLRGVTGVFKESLDRAEAWVERLRIIGIQRQRQREVEAATAGRICPPSEAASSQGWRTAPNSPGVDLQTLSIESVYGTPPASSVGSRRTSASDHDHDNAGTDTETEADHDPRHGKLRRRQRRKISASDDTSKGKPVTDDDA